MLSENYQRLAQVQSAAATELDTAALMYDDTDHAECRAHRRDLREVSSS
ncbi:hypothetical protein ACFSVJ_08050 [Prauserella oleivorans]